MMKRSLRLLKFFFLAVFVFAFSLLLIGCKENGTTDPVLTTSKEPEGTGSPTEDAFQMPEPLSGLEDTSLSLAAGEKKILTLTADAKVEFLAADGEILAVGDTDYADGENRVTLMGLAAGKTTLLAVKTDDFKAALLTVSVSGPLSEGESANRSLTASFTAEPTNSPSNEGPGNLGDDNTGTKWLVFSRNADVIADLGRAIEISSFSLTSGNDDKGRDPRDFSLYGSNDKEEWELLFEKTGEDFPDRLMTRSYAIESPGVYRYYKLSIARNGGDAETQLSEFALIEVGKKAEPITDIPKKSDNPSPVTGVRTDKEVLTLFAGESSRLTAEAEGGKSPIFFLSTDSSLAVTAGSYDKESGVTSVNLSASGGGRGSLLAFSKEGLSLTKIDFSAIGEGACTNVTSLFAHEGNGGSIDRLFDDRRTTVATLPAEGFELLFTAKDKTALVNRYAIVGGSELAAAPSSWRFYGSADGKEWTLLDERSDERFEGAYLRRIFDFDNKTPYAYYKLTLAGEGEEISFSEVQLFELGAYPSWALGPFEKVDEANPILMPNDRDSFLDPISGKPVFWSNEALYNPAAVVKDGVICVLYRSQDHPLVSRVGLALSLDGIHFDSLPEPVLYPEQDEFYEFEAGGGDEDPRVIKGPDGVYYMYYSAYNREKGICRLFVATSTDLEHWEKQGNAIGDAYNGKYKNTWAKSGSVICDMVGEEFIARKFEDGRYYMYFGEGILYLAWSEDLIHWTPLENESGGLLPVLSPRPGYYDSRLVECGPPAIYTDYGILLIYNGANADPGKNGDSMLIYNAYSPGQVVFDAKDPTKCIKITENCFMYPEKDYELEGLVNNVCFVEGLVYYQGCWFLYYGTADSRLAVAVYKPPVRNDAALEAAIARAEGSSSLSEEAKELLQVAKEALVAAIYSQAQVDDIAARLEASLG